MIDAVTVGEIVAQYEKHGWVLRRALLSQDGTDASVKILDNIGIEPCDFDALWFSRRSNPESEAWELRRLTGLPFALVAVISANASAEELEATLSQVVDEMRAKTMA
jgi:hypothetical protein